MTTSLYPGPYPAELTIDSRMDAAGVTLAIGGEIDLASAPALERELQEAEGSRPRRIVLDLEDLDFIDSAGVHRLFQAFDRATAMGHRLILTRVPAHAERLFSLTGINTRLTHD